MHAGDALWYLYGGLTVLDRKHSDDPDHLMLIQRMRECVGIIGAHIAIPEPPPTKMNELVDQLMVGERPDLDEYIDPQDEGIVSAERPTLTFSRDEDNVENALTLLDAMVSCGDFDWSEFILSLHCRLHQPDAFFTGKQWRGVIAVARKNDDFWELFVEEHPVCTKHGMRMAREADREDS